MLKEKAVDWSLVDSHVKKLVKQVDSVGIDWGAEKLELQKKINAGAPVARQRALDQIDTYSLDNKDKRILDYGCGTGIFNLLLLLKGYTEVHGVDVVPKFDARILERLGFSDASFNLIGVDERLPFEDGSFDVVTSCLVLEHVENLDFYYSEAARVLKPGGVCFFNFPHRLKPYDTHSRCWFIHYFPKPMRGFLWNIFARQDGEYLNNYLFLRTIYTHKRVARKYFRFAQDITAERIKDINFINYKGGSKLRLMADKLMNTKFIGGFFVRLFKLYAASDLYLVK